MGLPRANRLKHRRDFQAVYQQGIRRRGRCLTLRALQVPSYGCEAPDPSKAPIPETCIGISISQKVSKKAVVRNRIKRQIRAALQELLPHISPGWKMVLVVRPGAMECKYEHFLRELEQLLARAEVLDGHSREHLL